MQQKILEVGPDIKKSSGGMASVIRQICSNRMLRQEFNLTPFGSFRDGNKISRFLFCVSAYVGFLWNVRHYDIIHVHMTSGMSAFRKSFYINAGKRAGKKVVVSLHCCEYFSEEWTRRSSFYQKRVREALQKADRILLLAKRYQPEFERLTGVKGTTVLPNSIAVSDYPEGKKEGVPSILFLGKVRKSKGADTLLAAARDLAVAYHDRPDILFAGSGSIAFYKAMAMQYHLPNIRFTDSWVSPEEIKKLLQSFWILVLPSEHEGFPVSILEACASSMAIVATNVGAVPEMIREHVINTGDSKALCETLHLLIHDPGRCRKEGRENRKRVADLFSEDVIMNQLAAIYKKLTETERKSD